MAFDHPTERENEMSTLKVMWQEPVQGTADHPGYFANRTRWFGDVETVEVLGDDWYNSWGQVRTRHGNDMHAFAWLWDGDPDKPVQGPLGLEPRNIALTLVMVVTRGKTEAEMFLVERAWLLGPDGQTIDRIAP